MDNDQNLAPTPVLGRGRGEGAGTLLLLPEGEELLCDLCHPLFSGEIAILFISSRKGKTD